MDKQQLEIMYNDYFGFKEKASITELIKRADEKDLKKLNKYNKLGSKQKRLLSERLDSQKLEKTKAKRIYEFSKTSIPKELKPASFDSTKNRIKFILTDGTVRSAGVSFSKMNSFKTDYEIYEYVQTVENYKMDNHYNKSDNHYEGEDPRFSIDRIAYMQLWFARSGSQTAKINHKNMFRFK